MVWDLLAAVVGRFAAVYSDAPIEKVGLRKAAVLVFTEACPRYGEAVSRKCESPLPLGPPLRIGGYMSKRAEDEIVRDLLNEKASYRYFPRQIFVN